MKYTSIIKSLVVLTVATTLGLGTTFAKDKEDDAKEQAALAAKAKITKAEAEKTALAKVPGASVKKSEIEEEDGILIWSFDLTTPGTKDITEVTVDATTGKIVKVEKESADEEKNEKESGKKD